MESGATPRFTRILLTGPPGIGKTTICKKIFEKAQGKNYNGFYTEEVRSENRVRIGFDLVPLNQPDKRVALARIESSLKGEKPSKIRVGNYHVFVDKFEKGALPTLESKSELLIIDEIGKMELFSNRFYDCVENLFFAKTQKIIIATIPVKIPQNYTNFFTKIRQHENCKIFEVNKQNRDKLIDEIFNIVT